MAIGIGAMVPCVCRPCRPPPAVVPPRKPPPAPPPAGGGGPDTPIVNVRFRLNQDGSLNGEPVVVDRQNTPLFAIAADASVRAIKQCAPFQLPPDKYSAWSDVTWAFDWPVILGLVQR